MQKEEAIKLPGKKMLSAAIRSDEDKARFNAILEAEHYLGARQPSGNTVHQVIRDEAGEWVAVALWCGASSRRLPFGDGAAESLFGTLMGLGDGRRGNRSVSQAAVLAAAVLAQMCGRTTVSEIVRFAQGLTQAQKLLLGFPRCKKNRGLCVAPSRKTFDTVMQRVSPSKLAVAVPALPCAINIPFARSAIRFITRTTTNGVTKVETSDFVLNTDATGRTLDDLLEMRGTHWKGSESRNHWIRDAQYKEDLILQRKPVAILNRSLLINACAFITNTLRIREGKSTPMLRESFQKHPSNLISRRV